MTSEEIIQACCGVTVRYFTEAPFNKGGFRYGTDSRICARVKTTEADTDGTTFPPCEKLPGWGVEGPAVVLPELGPKPPQGLCGYCNGVKCDECGGTGMRDVFEPNVKCADGGVVLGPRYIRLLQSFGAAVTVVPEETKHGVCTRWVAGDVEGLLMTCREVA